MTRYYNPETKTEAVKGVHSLEGCVELSEDHIFFKPLPEDKEFEYDAGGIPCGYLDIPIDPNRS